MIRNLKKRAARSGHAPGYKHHERVLPGFQTKFITARYDADGNLAGEYHRQEPDKAREQELLRQFVDGLNAEIKQVAPTKFKALKGADPDLMAGIFIGDAHVGQYSYSPETRQGDFDTDIATAQIRAAIDYLVDKAPNAKTGLLVDVGDALHADSAHNQTFGGTPVDVDTRYHRTLDALALVMRYAINRMLEKFQQVIVVVARGNHNDSSAIAIQLMLKYCYEREKRVNILPTKGYFHYVHFGQWLIAVHHGDKVKSERLPGILARDLPELWGQTTHRMWALGHIHHQNLRELDGCKIRTFGTLAAPDGWHSSKGYGAERAMEMLVFRRSGGLHSTYIYTIPKESVLADASI
jgi:hypothetical protein